MLFNLNETEWMNSWEIHTDDGEETTYPNLKKKSSTWSSSPRGTTEHVGGWGVLLYTFLSFWEVRLPYHCLLTRKKYAHFSFNASL